MTVHLFAGLRVRDFQAARPWYEQLFGEPSFFPHDTEAVWTLGDGQAVGIHFVTTNRLLPQVLRTDFDIFQVNHGEAVWEDADILPLASLAVPAPTTCSPAPLGLRYYVTAVDYGSNDD